MTGVSDLGGAKALKMLGQKKKWPTTCPFELPLTAGDRHSWLGPSERNWPWPIRDKLALLDDWSLKHTGSLWLNLLQSYRNNVFAKIWHFPASVAFKDTKKPLKVWKRPQKAVKVISKTRESIKGKILILLHFCVHLVSKMKRIQYFDVSRS